MFRLLRDRNRRNKATSTVKKGVLWTCKERLEDRCRSHGSDTDPKCDCLEEVWIEPPPKGAKQGQSDKRRRQPASNFKGSGLHSRLVRSLCLQPFDVVDKSCHCRVAGLRQQGMSVLVSESDLQHSERMVDRVVTIDRGAIA